MKAKIQKIKILFLLATTILITKTTSGQFVFNGQLIERGEYRHGYGSAIDKEADPAAFISQRLPPGR
ncbi:MAG: hypothetical protein IPP71_03445 [Bacteroidetes bacterium]|nr:hypothetical protein [Bacteroidota bacterium]